MELEDIVSVSKIPNMQYGARQFLLWWEDVLAQGLQYIDQNQSSLEQLAALLVDAGNGSMARQLRLAASLFDKGDVKEWMAIITQQSLIARSLQQIESYDTLAQIDLLLTAGMKLKRKAWQAIPEIEDHWVVLAQEFQQIENLRERRVFLQSRQKGKIALLLDFLFRSDEFEDSWEVGAVYYGKLQFYPNVLPHRAKLLNRKRVASTPFWKGIRKWSTLQQHLLRSVNAYPWKSYFPLIMEHNYIHRGAHDFFLSDVDGRLGAQIDQGDDAARLLFYSQGQPFHYFGVWQQGQLAIKSLLNEGGVIPLKDSIWTH